MGWLTDAIRAIFEGTKGNVDYGAFALVAVLAFAALVGGAGFGASAGIAVVLAVIWVLLRYALLSIQSREKLRDLRFRATEEAQKKLEQHASKTEMGDLFKDMETEGDGDER